MAKKAYIGVSGIARKVKKMYVGVNGVARKVKKAYIGVAGIARLFWTGMGELKSYGTATPLTKYRYYAGAATIGNYALIAGGQWGSSSTRDDVNVYDISLTQSTADNLSGSRGSMGTATVGNYAILAGGNRGTSGNNIRKSDVVDVYDTSLTHSTPTSILSTARNPAGTAVGNYALFGGGSTSSSTSTVVEAYDTSLTKTTRTALSAARAPVATTVSDYALFGGGSNSSVVDAYNKTLTKVSCDSLALARTSPAATTVGGYAIFLGHSSNTAAQTTTDVYNSSLTKSMGPTVIVCNQMSATTLGNYALFGGNKASANMVVIDESLTYDSSFALSTTRYATAAASVGNYALFAGGYSGNHTTVDAFYLD